MNLQVSYKSQWDQDATLTSSDCGPTAVGMVLNYSGENLTTDGIFKKTGASSNSLITISQLQKAIISCGYVSSFEIGKNWDDCRNLLKQNIPIILLIHYGPLSSRQDKNYYGGHFIVLTGEDNDCWLVNDPDFWGNYRSDGEQHRYLKNEMELAWGQCAKDGNPPYSYLVINRKENNNMSNIYKGIDLTNIESVKVCVDAWKDVSDNKYVKKEDYQKLTEDLTREIDAGKVRIKEEKDRYDNFVKKLAETLNCPQDEPRIIESITKAIQSEDKVIGLEREANKAKEDLLNAEKSGKIVVKQADHSKLCVWLATKGL